METIPKEVIEYVTKVGRIPFREWVSSLKDKKAKAKIYNRLDKVERGTLGQTRSVGKGVHELKIDYAAGYRIYFANDGKTVVLLLCGGDKRTQDKDIKTAQLYWQDYKER